MIGLLAVGIGGALGAMLRYGISKIPFLSGNVFPWMTFVANLLGAVVIGVIAGVTLNDSRLTPNQVLLLKTGFCGGLTTFSTFSLEAFGLIETGRWGVGGLYMIASVVVCLVGVFVGRAAALKFLV